LLETLSERVTDRSYRCAEIMKDPKNHSQFGNIDNLLSQIDNKYLLVNVARVRAQQLVNHTEPLVEGSNPEKAVSTAFAEIEGNKLDITMDENAV
jgi:DNA-directed RNA polymerase omega subunit